MTFKQIAIARAREIAARWRSAQDCVEKDRLGRLMDTAVEDLRLVTKWYRQAARKRLRRMKAA